MKHPALRLRRSAVLIAALFAVAGTALSASPAHAEQAGLHAEIRGGDPTAPVLVLTNTGDSACQVVTGSTLGTLAITQAIQGGTPITPIGIDVLFPDGLENKLRERLHLLEPKASVEVPVRVVEGGPTGHALEMVVWSASLGSYAAIYPVHPDKPLDLDFVYSVPILVGSAAGEEAAPACVPTVGGPAQAADPTGGWPLWAVAGAAGALLLIVAVVLIVITRRRRRKAAPAALALLIVAATIGGVGWPAPPAHAVVNVPTSVQSAWDDCMQVFAQHPDITGPILDAVNDPGFTVDVLHDRTGDNHETQHPTIERGSWVFWDPDSRGIYTGPGGPGTGPASDRCTSLFHELNHAAQRSQGTLDRRYCGNSGIPITEVLSTRAENVLRAALGLPERTHYNSLPLPEGDCEPQEEPTQPTRPEQCSGAGCADSNGDPHLRTFDGVKYDFQAAGEFVAVHDPAGDLEVQVRQEPWSGSRLVSVNTSVAMRVGSDRVEVRSAGVRGLVVLVNGTEQATDKIVLPGGGQVDSVPGYVVVLWPDGSRALLRAIGAWGIHLSMQPATDRAGKLAGLFGDFDGDSGNDLRTRDGVRVTLPPAFEALYPAFADSWRVEQAGSLFTYPAGASTATYTDRSFPDRRVTASELANRDVALALCQRFGVTDPDLLENCVLDVALTGQADFALAAATSQAFTEAVDWGGTWWTVKLRPGEVAKLEFDATAGEKVYVDVPFTTYDSSCGTLRLQGPGGGDVARGCIINGYGHIDGTVLADAGKYTIVFEPRQQVAGQLRVQLVRISDQSGPIAVDGPEVLAVTDKPGVVSRFTFDGTAGQKVYLQMPWSTLDSQCGGFAMQGPGDKTVSTGCIINGRGHLEAVVLPETGVYTVIVDPRERNTGQTRLSLTSAVDQRSTITIDGPSVIAEIKQPGAAAYVTFTGVAGQRIFVDVVGSTLPSQCGGLLLQGPDDRTVISGCIINGTGKLHADGTVLTVSGTYTIVIDPREAAVGSATIRLRGTA